MFNELLYVTGMLLVYTSELYPHTKKGRLGAQNSDDIVRARVRRLQSPLDAEDGFRKRRQLQALVAQVLGQPFHELETRRLSCT